MSGFSPEWLALREGFDARARDAGLASRFLARLPRSGLVVDLGAGAGSNIAFLRARERGSADLRWRHVDADAVLIDVARARFAGVTAITYARIDLAQSLDAALDGADGVTCAALIDLASAAWIDRLVEALADARLPALIALSYDGRISWSPPDEADAILAGAFHRDMARDKGFGPALGPGAVTYLAEALRSAGALVARRPSDWQIAAGDDAMLAAMLDGVGEAAIGAAAPAEIDAVAAWRTRRGAARAAGTLALAVGHQDLSVRWA